MRRLALVSPYALSVPGGVQEQVLAMSREWSRRGAEVLVIAPDAADRTDHDTPATVLTFGRRLSVPANGSRAPLTLSWAAAGRAARALREFAPEVTHYHEPFAPLLAWRALAEHGAAQVGTFHRAGAGPAVSLTSALTRRLGRHLDASAAVSEAAAKTLAAAAGLECEVLFNGFESERFRAFARESGADPVVLFVGRLEARKGAGVVLSALEEHQRRGGARWRLVIAGDGPERDELERRAEGNPDVELLGAVKDEAKRRWLRRADVAVAASLRGESFGLVVLEPMAAETPVVVSDIDGYREAAGGHAALFAPGDPTALEAAIRATLEGDGARRVPGAREHAERWSMAALCDAYEVIYQRAREAHERAR